MTAYIAIATAIIVAVIALASWLLRKKIVAEFDRLEVALHARIDSSEATAHRTAMTVAETMHARFGEVTAGLRTHATQAVHEAIVTVRAVKHETCQICGKVSNIWKIADGKVECADCSIRKLVS